MDKDVVELIIQIVLLVVCFFVGKYVSKETKDTVISSINQLDLLLEYAEAFCAYAKQFLNDATGEEKMESVITKLEVICAKEGINVDKETLRAISQKAYNKMKNEMVLCGDGSNNDTLLADLESILNNNSEEDIDDLK